MLINDDYFEVRVIYYTTALQMHLNDYNIPQGKLIKCLCQVL